MRGVWRCLFVPCIVGSLGGCSDDEGGDGGGGGGGASNGGAGSNSGGVSSGGGGASNGGGGATSAGGAIDRNTCAICDVAARCCFAAVKQDYCNAYSTAECLKKMDPKETIEYCRIQVDAAANVEGCK